LKTTVQQEFSDIFQKITPKNLQNQMLLKQGVIDLVAQEQRQYIDNVVFSKRDLSNTVIVWVKNTVAAAEFNMQKEYFRIRLSALLKKPIPEVKFLVSKHI
jgi:hypothetical protein